MNLEKKLGQTQDGNTQRTSGLKEPTLPGLQKYMMQDAIYIPFTKEQSDPTPEPYDRACAWCPQPNEMFGMHSQLVFPFHYEVTTNKISHSICDYCARNEWKI